MFSRASKHMGWQISLTIFSLCSLVIPIANALPEVETTYTALVIGNSKYNSSTLDGPEHDAEDIAKVLKDSGFTISNLDSMTNLNQKQMTTAINDFAAKLQKNSFAVVYYSGHGLEEENDNYLVPTDAIIEKEEPLKYLIPLDWILKRLEQREAKTKIIILDACRNMPSALKYKDFFQNEGLAELKSLGPGTRIIYAASPRQKAIAAGAGERNSVFTAALLEAFKEKLSTFDEVINKAAQITLKKTGNKQAPWSAGVLGMSFSIAPPLLPTEPGTPPPEPVTNYLQTDMNTRSNCQNISQLKIENGISTWSKKCI